MNRGLANRESTADPRQGRTNQGYDRMLLLNMLTVFVPVCHSLSGPHSLPLISRYYMQTYLLFQHRPFSEGSLLASMLVVV